MFEQTNVSKFMFVYVCICVCVCAYMRACVWILDDLCHFLFTDLQESGVNFGQL